MQICRRRLNLSGSAFMVLLSVTLTGVVNDSVDAALVSDATTASVYRWQQSVEGDWQKPGNWSPPRTAPADDDVLIFHVGSATAITNIPNQTIGRLVVSGNTAVDLQAPSSVVLAIAGGDGDDLTVEQNSALNFAGSNAIAANLAGGTTARIDGSITFSSSGAAAHRLTAIDAGAIVFGSGSVFTAGNGFIGNPFGTINLNSVGFDDGSAYICIDGGDPFGAAEPDSVVVFRTDSLFKLEGRVEPSFSGRTYANFEVNYPGGIVIARGSSPLIMDDLTLRAGELDFRLTGNPGHSIKGNIFCFSGTFLDFSSGTIRFDGPATQTFTRQPNAPQGGGGAFTMIVDNPSGIIVNNGMGVGNLELVNGVITVEPSFVILETASRKNGYISGLLRRLVQGPGTLEFDVGTETGYSPVTANITAGEFPAVLDVRPIQAAQPNALDPSKALSRYWTLSNFHTITTDLTFHYLDSDIPATANESNLMIYRYHNGFTQPVGVVDPVANTFHITGVTDLTGDWTLAEPGAFGTPTPTPTPTATTTATPTATPTPTKASVAPFDYDADGRTDFSVFRPTDGAWYLQRSTEGFFGMLFGFSTDKITPADFDGDGKTDIAVFRPSDQRWYIANSADGTFSTFVFGLADDLPAPADYDGDGKADLCVFRPSDGTWYLQRSSNGSFFAYQFGAANDKPTVGDFDGDGKSDLAVFRTTNGEWYQVFSSDGSIHGEQFGFSSDKLAYADYDGDGKTDLAVFRPSTGVWYIRNSMTSTYTAFVFGLSDDIPTPGDYDGDGKADLSVFRPSDGNWYRQNSSNGSFNAFNFGLNGDRPTPTAYH